ncbi:MAG: S-methyl-5-thioribose-1-phosphate isomerase [Evtepia sp.]|uniref:S-methyl-5-thioribose-1-phosphate isomerase n=1 Tax=Evtepia sp. TaxID=2773933 RepID=UPI002A748452|nr:S-methyl-5-thioribose-1-phosphate isomerase [Evtepia sp.]MDY3014349.1 S-methyl-5-thioribose-1-phosphate isomerase [Evtepia sp.]
MDLKQITHADNVRLSDDGRAVRILDQSRLPNETVYLELSRAEDLYEAIATLRVRGAPAIGIFAAYAMYVLTLQSPADQYSTFVEDCQKIHAYLNASRPTAVNLRHMLDRMLAVAESMPCMDVLSIQDAMKQAALAIHQEDIAMCTAISEYGLSLVKPGDGILTHCNAGPLATSRYGTGLGPLFLAKERGIPLRAFCDETRPLLQGARLTTYELQRAGIDCTLICDNMASLVMKEGKINACFVGCDRVARNGDTANKIGTSGVAILAKYYGIPFYVLGPSSTIDFTCPDGDHIPIELREGEEIKEKFFSQPSALPDVKCYNPAFDVTDHSLITAIVTEKGICYPPFEENLAKLFSRQRKGGD